MASTTVSNEAQRLEALRLLCSEMASGISSIRTILRGNAEDASAAYLAADALDRIGWMADQATVLAGEDAPLHGGDAFGWLLCCSTQDAIRTARKEG